ncbi:MAG: efflux RND transporter periplasmic adaptor subunit, partial [Candidatus Sericytochromatia bacterium]
MNRLLTLALAAAVIAASGCRQEPPGHSHEGEAAHSHGPTMPTEAVTVFTPKTELFAEYRALVAGQGSRFAAHLTDLRDWSPVTEGRVEAVLMRPDGRQEVFAVEQPARPGIFQPVVTPSEAGTYVLAFRLVSPGLTDTIRVGEVTVYPSANVARAAATEEAEDAEAISYLKEQQWKVSFMTRPVEAAALEAGVTLQGTIRPAGGREVAITAPAEGRVVTGLGQQPQLGDRVAAGQLLAVVTPTEGAGQDRATLEEAVAAAEARVKQAELDFARAERLVAGQAAPAKRLEEARTALAIARARLAAARDHLRAKIAALTGTA